MANRNIKYRDFKQTIKMENWFSYTDRDNINVDNILAKEIITTLATDVSNKFYSSEAPIKSPKKRTTKLFEVLTLLGDKKGYKVYSHSLSKKFMEQYKNEKGDSKFVNREWLYDLLWYKEDNDGGYFPLDFPLIVESEWWNTRREDKKRDRYSAIKYDFQKLLLANTGLRLMIFKISKEEELKLLSKYFNNAITKYTPLKNGEFLFVAFHDDEKSFHYCYKEKK
jgi:hypothetical protein